MLNSVIRNGDAHLKNFGVIYDHVTGPAHLAPVYDLVSTILYLRKDAMGLTLNDPHQLAQSESADPPGPSPMRSPPDHQGDHRGNSRRAM